MISVTNERKRGVERMVAAGFAAAQKAGKLPDAELPGFLVEVPADTAKGDFATNAAMAGARALHMAPAKIAEAVLPFFDLESCALERCETAGPGFINFFVRQQGFSEILREVFARGADYGRSDVRRGQKIMVEFVSANPTGPIHMGNARGGAVGDILAAALDWAGADVTREFYVNDAGNQIEKFGLSLEARYLQIYRGEEAVPFPEDGYHGEDIAEHARNFAKLHGDAYLDKPEAERRQALIDYALPLNLQSIRDAMDKYRIRYDVWFPESELHKGSPSAIDQVIGILRDKGLVYEKDGALWYRATDFGDEKDEVLVRGNGVPTYFAADIAYHYNKFAVRGFDRVINVWGADHHGHVARLKGAMDAVGLDGSRLDVVLMQLVRLIKDGEPYRMSKRSGHAVSLTDLLDEVPIDCVRFFFNMREPGSAFDFDLDLAVKQSADNPVYYVQYAYARICSLEKLLAEEGVPAADPSSADLDLLTAPEEKELIRRIGDFPEEIAEAAAQYDPAKLTKYAVDLATLFHKFYHNCHIRGCEAGLCEARLCLCAAAKQTLKNVLTVLSVTAPEVM